VAPLRLRGLRGKKSTPSIWLGGTGVVSTVGQEERHGAGVTRSAQMSSSGYKAMVWLLFNNFGRVGYAGIRIVLYCLLNLGRGKKNLLTMNSSCCVNVDILTVHVFSPIPC
jgi:hypothetical protein